ncbi:MAG TPA: hypothetical protein VKB19_02780, partial [Pedobacter sp.]|nr:hypothetical protein [Pedobacter sp.]
EVLNCTIHDLLPEGVESTGDLVDKAVISLGNEGDVLLVLEGLIGHGFFAVRRTVGEVAKYLFVEKADQLVVLEAALRSLAESGRLRSDKEGFVL